MFYQTGIDITNNKQMFNFLNSHPTYYTANPWNGLESIAHDVKLDRLGLSGNWATAYDLLASGEYDTLNCIIQRWCEEHEGYEVFFNGRSGGHLVLTHENSNRHILPEEIAETSNYAEFKQWCKDCVGSVKDYHQVLVEYTKLVRDFDKLCDQLRDYCDELSNLKFEVIEMQKAVEEFNDCYASDLEYLEFQYLRCDDQGIVDLSEILSLQSMTEAFLRIAKRSDEGYGFEWLDDNRIRLSKK